MLDDLSVIIPYRNGNPENILQGIMRRLPEGQPIIVVDDMSDPPARFQGQGVKVIRPGKRGYFSGAVNAGIAACQGDVLILNQDAWLEGDRWQTFIAKHRQDAIAGDGVVGHPAWPQSYVQGTFQYMNRQAINAVGLLNELDFPLWGGLCEWQLRACRKGFTATPAAVPGLHHERQGNFGTSIAAALREEPKQARRFLHTPPLVSVVIPCYNYGRYLPDAVASLIGGETCMGHTDGQTFAAFDVTIVDDRSTDDSWQIAQSMANDWKGVHALRMPKNGGTAAAMNYGIERSYGRFIMAMDADDMLEPAALDTFYGIVSEDEHAVPYCDQQIVTDGKKAETWPMREYDFDQLIRRNLVPAGIMFAREGWTAAGRYREEMKWGRQDWAFAVALGRAGYCGHHISAPLYLQREGQNRTLRNSDQQWRATFTQQMRDLFPDLYRGERPMGCCGGQSRRPQPQAPQAQMKGQIAVMQAQGQQGLRTMMEYIGESAGESSWFGVTGMVYRFGARRKVGYVYDADVPALLDLRKGRRPQFKVYEPPTAEYDEPGPPPVVVAPVQVQAEEPIAQQDTVPDMPAPVKKKRSKKADA